MILNTKIITTLVNPMDGGAWWATVHGVSKIKNKCFSTKKTKNKTAKKKKKDYNHPCFTYLW